MGELIDMHVLEVKRAVRRREYTVDVDAVAEAIVRRIVSGTRDGGAASVVSPAVGGPAGPPLRAS